MSYPKGVHIGNILIADDEVRNNIGQRFEKGTEFRVDRIDPDHDCISLEVPGDYFNGGYWFYFDDLAITSGYPDNKFVIKE